MLTMCTLNPAQSDIFVQQRQHVAPPSQSSVESIIRVLTPLFAGEVACQLRRSKMATPRSRNVPSFQTFVKSVPSNPDKALPPDPPMPTTVPQPTHHQLRRSSSVYTRNTGFWETEAVISPSKPRSFSTSSPQLAIPAPGSPVTPMTPEPNSIAPILEPHRYQPILPSPSPSLAPASARNSYVQASRNQNNKDEEGYWSALAPSPPFSPIDGPLEYSQSPLDLSSPTTSPSKPPRARSVTPPKSRLSRPFSPTVVHQREGSMKKVLASLGVSAEEAGLSSGGKNKELASPTTLEFDRKASLNYSSLSANK